ncbi:hypothetical protein [Actinoplanes sp. L3-i22]|uniref:hypothetical protein n=1 Tax=Actinoplanes sp. L3-i22 TaxID=2836373 RepID=UPI001C774C53|nr:hypothetical protein [Actinoplanes sp. L3-i22]BCY07335.1 hypothetical protein L3i22_024230 [Actinoplanes sp. L3-i22]
MTTPHLLHPRDPRQAVCGIAADQVLRWETDDPPRGHTCEECLTDYEEAARPDDANHPIGDATLIDTLRRIAADRQILKVDGVLIDAWSASVTVLIWDQLRDDKRQRLLTLPSHELILRCVCIYTTLTARGNAR